jgi:hypothetical protein
MPEICLLHERNVFYLNKLAQMDLVCRLSELLIGKVNSVLVKALVQFRWGFYWWKSKFVGIYGWSVTAIQTIVEALLNFFLAHLHQLDLVILSRLILLAFILYARFRAKFFYSRAYMKLICFHRVSDLFGRWVFAISPEGIVSLVLLFLSFILQKEFLV